MPEKGRKEKLEFEIRKSSIKSWKYYKHYHYLNQSIPNNGHCFEVFLKEKRVGFISIGKFAHPKAKDIFMFQRTVIVPEFQGFGIANKVKNIIADIYSKKGYRVRSMTSLKSYMQAMQKDPKWKLVRFGRVSKGSKNSGSIHKQGMKNISMNRVTASFEYIG